LAKVAEERGFALAYPVQSASANPLSCWNWSGQGHLHRGAGEASIIAGITTSLVGELGSDAARVYVGGYSAGGAMSTVMGATYPDVYAAIAPSSGGPYAISDITGQQAYAEMGPRARPMPAFIVQGLLDELSNYVFGRFNLLQWLGTDDYADDGASNNTVSRLPSGGGLKLPGPGLPIPLVLEDYRSRGCHLAQFVTSPMEHLINGYLISADLGIGLQRLMMSFLLAHRLGGPTQGCG
jgi:poly(hydroxyalkanoate) depolymerase family esterase